MTYTEQLLRAEICPNFNDYTLAMACTVFIESPQIEVFLTRYKGKDKTQLIKTWLNYLAIYYKNIQ